jgi:hypothetical protein
MSQLYTGGGTGGVKVSARHSVVHIVDGIEYDEEQWWRMQVLERLDAIISLLRQRESGVGGAENFDTSTLRKSGGSGRE